MNRLPRIHLTCECGHKIPIRRTGFHGVDECTCAKCKARYSYSAWTLKRTDKGAVDKVEAIREKTS